MCTADLLYQLLLPNHGSAYRLWQINSLPKTQFFARPGCAGHVALRWLLRFGLPSDDDFHTGIRRAGHEPGQLGNAQIAVGTHVVSPAGMAFQQNRPQPNCEVGGVKIRTIRRAVAADLNRAAFQRVPNEVADGEMGVQWQGGADETEADGGLLGYNRVPE